MPNVLEKQLQESLRAAGIEGAVELSAPPQPEMGDFAFACFGIAKERKKSPNEAAKEIKIKLAEGEKLGIIERVEALGPYLNFFLKPGAAAAMVIEEVERRGEEYGHSNQGEGQEGVLIEYPSNNTHKEFHIGHFRIACIGNALVKLYRAGGYDTHPINYLNDFGAHVARCLWGLLKFHADENPPENKQKWLGEIYAEASNVLAEHPERQPEVDEIQKKLEARDAELWPLFSETRQWSIDGFEKIFRELGVEHAADFYEKDIKEEGQGIVDELLQKGIAQVGEGGAIIIDLSAYALDIALVRKSNGVGLYLTSDLPLAKKKFERFKVEESIVITGQEQDFYFRQLHKILELLGFKKKLTHLNCGLVERPGGGKMSSRGGGVVLYEDLREEVNGHFYAQTKDRHPEWSEKKIISSALKLALAALKFDIQKHEAAKNIIFDIKEATSFEGFSAPYVLYVVARINSIIRKSAVEELAGKINYDVLEQAEEKRLVLLMAEYPGVLEKALSQYNPSTIARYCFDLAQAFNDFYNRHNILNAQGIALVHARLALATAVKQVLQNALGILTIETVEEM